MRESQISRELWFERVTNRLGVPLWVGALVIAIPPTIALGAVSDFILPLSPSDLLFGFVQLSILTAPLALLYFYASSYLRRRVEALEGLVETHEGSPEELFQSSIRGLYSLRGVLFTFLALSFLFVPLFTLGQPGSAVDNLVGGLPYSWGTFLLGTFFWVFGYSMYSVYRIGKLPLKLRPYTQDRTLGMRPFGTITLRFSLIYLAIATFLSLIIILGGVLPLSLSLLVPLVFYPAGFLFFLLPLLSIHRKLGDAKSKELIWLEPRATAILQKVKAGDGTPTDQSIVNELTIVDKMQRDIQQIHTWPFDTGLIVRLAAVIISLVAILLSAIVRDLLKF